MKKALVAAVWQYLPPDQLIAPEFDLVDWQQTLAAKGYVVTTLPNPSVASIRTGLTSLCRARAGDKICFVFVGHGTKIQDMSGDESDNMDEAITGLYLGHPDPFTDDSIRMILALLPANVDADIIHDCCYAGTGSRAVDGRKAHYVPPIPGKRERERSYVPVNLNHAFWGACKDSEISYEDDINGIQRSFFSYWMCRCLREHPTYTRSQMISWIQSKISIQTPQLECNSTKAGQVPFT